jgi:DNA-binding transcriptional regulator YdaS (Cro superfamily)
MKTEFAVKKAGSKIKLAALLGVTRQAVTQWRDELPPLQVYRLREVKPKWFAEWKRSQEMESS